MRQRHARALQIQQDYYSRTVSSYDTVHLRGENSIAMAALCRAVRDHDIKSVLDIGSGTGRVLRELEAVTPEIRLVGIEPSEALRTEGLRHLRRSTLIGGDAVRLPFADGEFDMVCEVAALHHMPDPRAAVNEMIRVARKAVFICDSNNFGGVGPTFAVKRLINALGLWPLADWIRTGGKRYMISEGDGLFYSYSVFNDLPALRSSCSSVLLIDGTQRNSADLYRESPTVAVLALK